MTVGHIGLFLLDWGKRQGNTAFDAMRWETEERMPRGAAQKVVDLRVETGHLTRAGSGLEVSLTELGEAEIVSARSRRRALKPRRDYTRTAFVRWLYKARPMQSVDFVKVPGSIYLGERLRPVEIGEAANYLGGKGLIDFTDWGVGQLFDPRLTAQGIDCAESGKTVSEFLTPPPAAPVFNVTVNGGTNVVGVNNTQNNGLSGTELVTFRALAAARAPVERGVARLKSWQIFRRSRCSPNRMTAIAKAILTLERQCRFTRHIN